jgi:type IV pilus assembly protein PilN
MAHVNLLPWRAERRKQREREFYMQLVAAFVVALGVLLLWIFWMDQRIDNQNERNAYLQTEIKQLDVRIAKIKDLEKVREHLLARKQIIEQLQADRSQMVHLFDELVKTIPDGVRLNSMKQAGDTLTLTGVAQSNASVAEYMKRLDASQWLKRTDLQQTEAKGGDRREPFAFGLTVKLTSPEEKEKERLAAEGKTAPDAPAAPGAAKPAATPPASTTGNPGSKP